MTVGMQNIITEHIQNKNKMLTCLDLMTWLRRSHTSYVYKQTVGGQCPSRGMARLCSAWGVIVYLVMPLNGSIRGGLDYTHKKYLTNGRMVRNVNIKPLKVTDH